MPSIFLHHSLLILIPVFQQEVTMAYFSGPVNHENAAGRENVSFALSPSLW